MMISLTELNSESDDTPSPSTLSPRPDKVTSYYPTGDKFNVQVMGL